MHIVPQTIMRETTLLGTEVTNFQSETLGRIRDFVISDNGNIPYAITEVNDRWCFIPTTALTIDRFHRLALVDIPQKRLTALASFEPGALPDLNISNWDMEIRAFWLSELGLKANEMSPNLIISATPARITGKISLDDIEGAGLEKSQGGMILFCDFNENSFDSGLMLQKITHQLNRPCTISAPTILGIENGQ